MSLICNKSATSFSSSNNPVIFILSISFSSFIKSNIVFSYSFFSSSFPMYSSSMSLSNLLIAFSNISIPLLGLANPKYETICYKNAMAIHRVKRISFSIKLKDTAPFKKGGHAFSIYF